MSGRPIKLAQNIWLALLVGCTTMTPPHDVIQADVVWRSSGEFCEPETVLALPDDSLLISNVCDFNTRGDGFLSLLKSTGHVIDWRIVDGLDSPLGMAMHNQRIYVVDRNNVKVFAWPGFAPLEEHPLATRVANDIAVSAVGNIYVTDTAAGKVVVVYRDGRQQALQTNTTFTGANGIEFGSDGLLYIGGTSLWQVDLESKEVRQLGPSWLEDIDGIELEAAGTIQVTPVGGPLIRLLPDGSVETHSGPGISSANHGFAPRLGLALIPTGFDQSVIALRIPKR